MENEDKNIQSTNEIEFEIKSRVIKNYPNY